MTDAVSPSDDARQTPEVRVSDAERQHVIDRLRDETAAGRLTLDEFDERAGEVWAAKTKPELLHALRELPDPALVLAGTPVAEPPDLEVKAKRRYRASVRNELAGFVSANGICGAIWYANGADGRFWPIWILVPTSIGLLTKLLKGPDVQRAALEREWRQQQRAVRRGRPQPLD